MFFRVDPLARNVRFLATLILALQGFDGVIGQTRSISPIHGGTTSFKPRAAHSLRCGRAITGSRQDSTRRHRCFPDHRALRSMSDRDRDSLGSDAHSPNL